MVSSCSIRCSDADRFSAAIRPRTILSRRKTRCGSASGREGSSTPRGYLRASVRGELGQPRELRAPEPVVDRAGADLSELRGEALARFRGVRSVEQRQCAGAVEVREEEDAALRRLERRELAPGEVAVLGGEQRVAAGVLAGLRRLALGGLLVVPGEVLLERFPQRGRGREVV